jgi:hypothetical protein
VKTYVGTVLWRLDNVSNGPGQPVGTAIRADIDVPEAKFQASLSVQKNTDSTLPASHMLKLRFTPQTGAAVGTVNQINVPQMRREEMMTGESLSGIPVPITENSFLVGLNRGNAEATNLELMKARPWFDIPMLLANGRVAKLTFEKGTSGDRAFEEAISAWQNQ